MANGYGALNNLNLPTSQGGLSPFLQQNLPLLMAAQGAFQAGAPSPTPVSTGQVVGGALNNYLQGSMAMDERARGIDSELFNRKIKTNADERAERALRSMDDYRAATLAAKKYNQPLVKIIDEDGQPKFVQRSEGIGKTPYISSTNLQVDPSTGAVSFSQGGVNPTFGS